MTVCITRTEVNQYSFEPNLIGSGNTAEYVCNHAERQAKKRKNPSVAYKGELNPKIALQMAQSDIEARKQTPDPYKMPFPELLGRFAVVHIKSDDPMLFKNAEGYVRQCMKQDGVVGGSVMVLESDAEVPEQTITNYGSYESLLFCPSRQKMAGTALADFQTVI